MEKKRPEFRKPKAAQSYETPEELFAKLPNRVKSHGYLRGPQTDALRDYIKLQDNTDIACELPTGTGKTTVGLLIAEWRRRQTGERVAYLTLTNQLAKQVLREAESLGIDCANLIGTKETRDAGEVGRYTMGRAIGVTTFSNLFNVNPVVQASNVLVFDDAHGGEHSVASMWTVRIDAEDHQDVYQEVLAALRPSLSESQYRVVTDEAEYVAVELADIHARADVLTNITAVLDEAKEPSIHFPWTVIRNNLIACLFFVSVREIVIRPIAPPTHTHAPFSETKQRIYMSATLGGEGDLLRGYGVTGIETIRVKHAQWGRRYIFMPSLYFEEEECPQVVSSIWNGMSTHRALILAPSFPIANRTFDSLSAGMNPSPAKLGAWDIENSLEPFTTKESAVLCLAGRYDGVDLPGDDCRLLVLAESPGAIGALERHLREHWKLGPLLRRRERTRLIQGMGRCTRDATDFAVIILLGQSLVDSITPPAFSKTLPGEIQRELSWGMEQGEVAREESDALTGMIVGLLTDEEYRKNANESIAELDIPNQISDELGDEDSGKAEVLYLRSMWSDDYTGAYQIARRTADDINKPELAGYRAWWLFLASIAARAAGETEGEIDCLKRAKAIGINSGFLDSLLRLRSKGAAKSDNATSLDVQAESIWNQLASWGWQGPVFKKKLEEMMTGLSQTNDYTKFHIGMERLGQCLGAEVIRSTADGAPDVVWVFHDRYYTFEAKAGTQLSKRYVLQAKGHPAWVQAERPELSEVPMQALIVAAGNEVDESAKPHIKGLNFISTAEILKYGQSAAAELKKLRTQFVGKDFGVARDQLKAEIQQAKLDCGSIENLLGTSL
ncbi:DEAD/DEAH box helicase [Acidithiobacillus sulfuriphilus]|uniref:DEAD/DEAH box helicase n=2 Tax=Acidithiobacillus sulfuriphilus TaxID=1867749 RepID=A0A3M8RIU1_9PROT|nr:DEAD/DEAH box helicase [Acidithiobacillus sulfuriphilus]RNF68243.1 DEAD/DEAH box helicase [Acidithiobacillus sulfuriphilus]